MNPSYLTVSDGAALAYWSRGDISAPVTLFMAHGWTLDHEVWDDVADALLAGLPGHVRVVQYDARGHGRSIPGREGTATLERLADDLAELIDRCAPAGRLMLAGHSMGGMTMMALAERHRGLVTERVSTAAFVATSSGRLLEPLKRIPGFWWFAARLLRLGASVGDWPRSKVVTRVGVRMGLFGKQADWRDVARSAAQMERVDADAQVAIGMSLLRHDRQAALSAYDHIDTVVFAGGRDQLTPAVHGRRIAEGISGAMLLNLPGAGHMLPYERADEVVDELFEQVRLAAFDESESRLYA